MLRSHCRAAIILFWDWSFDRPLVVAGLLGHNRIELHNEFNSVTFLIVLSLLSTAWILVAESPATQLLPCTATDRIIKFGGSRCAQEKGVHYPNHVTSVLRPIAISITLRAYLPGST